MTNHPSDKLTQLMAAANLPEEKQSEMMERLGQSVFEAVLARVIGDLTPEDRSALEGLLDEKNKDRDAVLDFLAEHVPELDEIVKEETEKLTADMSTFFSVLEK